MAIFELDGEAPDLPADGRYWIADSAVVLNGARIGKNCLVGAGAVVTEGKEFADSSLILGSPARAVRALDEKAARAIADGADIYVRRWQQYAKGLKRIG